MARQRKTTNTNTPKTLAKDEVAKNTIDDSQPTAQEVDVKQEASKTSTDAPKDEEQGNAEATQNANPTPESNKSDDADSQPTENQSADAGDKSNEDVPNVEVQTNTTITGKTTEVANPLVVKVKNPTSVRAFEPLSMTEIGAYSEVEIVCKSIAKAQQVKANIQQLTKLGRKLEILK